MCTPKISSRPSQPIASADNEEANGRATLEARLRRRRAGAAADILTGPSGIPVSPTLGGMSQ